MKPTIRKSKPGVRCPRKIFIQTIYIDSKSKPLKNKVWLLCSYDRDNSQYLAEIPELNIFDFNSDLHVAIQSIKEQVGMLWKEYVEADSSSLTTNAVKFREKIQEMVVRS